MLILPILEAFVDIFVFNESLSFNFGFAKVGEPFSGRSHLYFICIKKKTIPSPSAAVVVVISMASASQYDSRRHSNMAQTRPNFFILTL